MVRSIDNHLVITSVRVSGDQVLLTASGPLLTDLSTLNLSLTDSSGVGMLVDPQVVEDTLYLTRVGGFDGANVHIRLTGGLYGRAPPGGSSPEVESFEEMMCLGSADTTDALHTVYSRGVNKKDHSDLNPILFKARPFDHDLGLYYIRARWYSPHLGRWLSEDPQGYVDGENLYAAFRNDPVNLNDPSGEVAESVWDAASLAIGTASFGYNIANENYGMAAWDAFGMVVDTTALLIPGLPGGMGALTKAQRLAKGAQTVNWAGDAVMGTSAGIEAFGDGRPVAGTLQVGMGLFGMRGAARNGSDLYFRSGSPVKWLNYSLEFNNRSILRTNMGIPFDGIRLRNLNDYGDISLTSSGIRYGSYDRLRFDPSIRGQAHHLNQDAAFKGVIPTGEGVSIELFGNAFTQKKSWHYKAHASLENFWNNYRLGTRSIPAGQFVDQLPTNMTYSRALLRSLQDAGFNKIQALDLVRVSIRQRLRYGMHSWMEIPNIPGRLQQVK